MDTRIIKGILALATLFWAVTEFMKGNIWSGIFITLLAAVIILFLFRSIRLLMAFIQLRGQKIDKAKRWIARIKNPEKMWKKQQAYYYYLKGLTESQTQSMADAERNFKKAINLGLRMDYDKAVAKLNLAMIAMNKGRKKECMALMAEVKRLDSKGMLKNEIKMVNQAMKKGPQVSYRRR